MNEVWTGRFLGSEQGSYHGCLGEVPVAKKDQRGNWKITRAKGGNGSALVTFKERASSIFPEGLLADAEGLCSSSVIDLGFL